MKRFAPANLVAKEVLSKPEFGALSTVTLVHGNGPYEDLRRMMLFNGIHTVDLSSFFGGDTASASAHPPQTPVGAKALAVSFACASGAAGTLDMNAGHHWKDCFASLHISGTGSASGHPPLDLDQLDRS